MQAKELWDKALPLLQGQIGLINALHPLSLEGNVLKCVVANSTVQSMFSGKHRATIEGILSQVATYDVRIEVGVDESLKVEPPPISSPSAPPSRSEVAVEAAGLNPRYTFDNFVVADCNRFAHAAAQQVARNPGRSYNPLFLHSKPGLGKTMLMQAIGHAARKMDPRLQVMYLSAEDFVNDLIGAIRENRTAEFRRRYRHVDVWLVDDFQFIAAIEGPASEEEFFHTLNTLCLNEKQVVIASDVPPRQLSIMNDRLRSRLEMGILADLRVPDVETRVAILEKKAEAEQVSLPRNILEYLAKKIESNIRVLEGALLRVCAGCSLGNISAETLTIAMVDEMVGDYSTCTDGRRVSLNEIVSFVSGHYDVAVGDIIGPKRTKVIAWPRQVAVWLARELTDHSLADIGNFFGGRDHSTILYAFNVVAGQLDPADAESFDESLLHRLHGMKADLMAG